MTGAAGAAGGVATKREPGGLSGTGAGAGVAAAGVTAAGVTMAAAGATLAAVGEAVGAAAAAGTTALPVRASASHRRSAAGSNRRKAVERQGEDGIVSGSPSGVIPRRPSVSRTPRATGDDQNRFENTRHQTDWL